MDILGTLRPPRLPSAGKPASPAKGELYFDTDTNVLYWWSGTAWVSASGTSVVFEQPNDPGAQPVGTIWIDTDDVAPTFVGLPLVSTLPSNPVDGQEVLYLASDTNGVTWRLRYRAASTSAYKWEFVGGPPLTARSTASEGTIGGLAWHATPVLTIPRAGEYICGFVGNVEGQPNTLNLQVAWSMQLGDGSAAFGVDFGSEFRFVVATGNPLYRQLLNNQGQLKVLAAGATLKIKPAPAPINWDYISSFRAISALPVRIS